ncbi:MAG: SIS domain-containing protein [Lentisphaeria bacterium]|nr:SIS domain-containing protein [Lentisphaeria bacterium]
MEKIFAELLARYPQLAGIRSEIEEATRQIIQCFSAGNQLLICGNGGSASDADHIAGEFLKGFKSRRELSAAEKNKFNALFEEDGDFLAQKLQGGFPTVVLSSHTALLTAFGNDVDGELSFAQHLFAQGRSGDVLLGISTGGNASNICYALMTARAKNISSILLTGNTCGKCCQYADLVLAAPESETFKIQELHLPIYHAICAAVERYFYEK